MMTLYSGTTCPFSHRCRIVLHEKQADFRVIDVDLLGSAADIAAISPEERAQLIGLLRPYATEREDSVTAQRCPFRATVAKVAILR